MNQQPKTSYQDFLKDIYSAMKKINQTTGDIFTKLETLDTRIANLEKSYVLLSEDIKKILNESGSGPANSPLPAKQSGSAKLMSLLTQLNDSVNDVSDTGMNVYTLGTNTALEAVFNNPKPSPSFNTVCTGLGSPDSEDNYGSLTYDILPVKLPFGSNITQNSMQNSMHGNMNDDFMILE